MRKRFAGVRAFLFLQPFGKVGGGALRPDGKRNLGLEALWNLQRLVNAVAAQARHAMGMIAEHGCLQRGLHPGPAGVKAVIGARDRRLLDAIDKRVGEDKDQRRRAVGPALVEVIQQAEEIGPDRLRPAGIDEPLGLHIEGRRRPACRFQNGQQIRLGHI